MVSIETARCSNPDCRVGSFSYASCEPPICPACGLCAECGLAEIEHEYGSCPVCDNCGYADDDDELINMANGDRLCSKCYRAQLPDED